MNRAHIEIQAADLTRPAIENLGYNGNMGYVSTDPGISYIRPENKLVVTNRGRILLAASVAWNIILTANGAAIGPDAYSAAVPRALELMAVQAIHALVSMLNPVLDVHHRASDLVAASNDWAGFPAGFAEVVAACNGMLATLATRHQGAVAGTARMVLLGLLASAHHRGVSNGHNWIHSNDETSAAYRSAGVGGAERQQLLQFMSMRGHDLWHFLTDDSMTAIALEIVGKSQTNRVIAHNAAVVFGSRADVRNMRLVDVLQPGKAAVDRLPVGTPGKAGILTGLNYVHAMLGLVMAKVSFEETPAAPAGNVALLVRRIEAFRAWLEETDQHDAVQEATDRLAHAMVSAYGFVRGTNTPCKEPGQAFESLQRKHQAAFPTGFATGQAFMGLKQDQTALKTYITASFSAVAAAIGAAMGEEALVIPAPMVPKSDAELRNKRDNWDAATRAVTAGVDIRAVNDVMAAMGVE